MVTKEQLSRLQKYADGLDPKIRLSFSNGGSVDIRYGGEHWVSLANKASSFLSMKRVKLHIDKCANAKSNQVISEKSN